MINILFFFLFMAAQSESSMIAEGQPAPFSGILFTPEAAADILSQHQARVEQLKIDLEYKYNIKIVELQSKLEQTNILLNAEKEKNEVLRIKNQELSEKIKEEEKYKLITPALAITSIATSFIVTSAFLTILLQQ